MIFRGIFIIVEYFRYINSGCIRIFMSSLAGTDLESAEEQREEGDGGGQEDRRR